MIEHLRGREKALEPLGWTGREAEWIALVCLHSGVFTRAQFCRYFNTQRMTALRFVKALIEQRAAVETDVIPFNGGGKTCRISGKGIYRALGVENIRHRRKANRSVVMRRLLSLDFVLEHPGLNWLPTEGEKVEFIEGLGVHSQPHLFDDLPRLLGSLVKTALCFEFHSARGSIFGFNDDGSTVGVVDKNIGSSTFSKNIELFSTKQFADVLPARVSRTQHLS